MIRLLDLLKSKFISNSNFSFHPNYYLSVVDELRHISSFHHVHLPYLYLSTPTSISIYFKAWFALEIAFSFFPHQTFRKVFIPTEEIFTNLWYLNGFYHNSIVFVQDILKQKTTGSLQITHSKVYFDFANLQFWCFKHVFSVKQPSVKLGP